MNIRKLILSTAVLSCIIMGITCANAKEEDDIIQIMPIRMEEQNTYNISVSYNPHDDYDWSCDTFTDTNYKCKLYIDEEFFGWLGYGTADRYFYRSGIVYWNDNVICLDNGNHKLEVKIYKNGDYLESEVEYIYVCPPLTDFLDIYPQYKNESYSDMAIVLINELCKSEGLSRMGRRSLLDDLADDRLNQAIYWGDFSHDYIAEAYDDFGIHAQFCAEYYGIGYSTPYEFVDALRVNTEFMSDLRSGYDKISVSAYSDSNNNMNWVVEMYEK